MVSDILSDLFSTSSKGFKRSDIREILKLIQQPGIISLAGGLPYPGVFPKKEMVDISKTVFLREGEKALQYGATEGDPRLVQFICDWMNKRENLSISPENVLIISGSQQALDFIGRVFIDPGDPIIVGLPSYLGALQAFTVYQPEFVGVPVDDHGMDADVVEQKLIEYQQKGKKVKFIYTVPDFQNPAGVTLSLPRRKKLIELAEKYSTLIVEDSPYRDLRYEGQSLPMMNQLDEKGYVFSLHTFSKIFAPGARLGWIVAHPAILDKFIMAKQPADLCSTPLSQALVYEFCARGMLEPHIDKIVKLYGKKQQVMLNAMEKYMPKNSGIQWTHPEGGMFLWMTLPEQMNARELFPKAIEKKVAYVVGSSFHFDGSGTNTIRLNFSYPSEEQIDEAIKRLASVFEEVL